MTAILRPCPACSRHVRVSELACPFCSGPFDSAFGAGPAPRAPTVRLARAALFALGAGTAGLSTTCSSSSGPVGPPFAEDGGDDTGLGIVFYGSAGGLDAEIQQTIACMNAADCLPGQVCCGAQVEAVQPPYGGPFAVEIGLTRCETAPCPTSDAGLGTVQLCQRSLECVQPGFVCTEEICGPPREAGTAAEGGQGDATSDGASTTDASGEGASPGDSSPGDDAAALDDSD